MVNSPNSVFTGVPVGSTTLLPDGKYTPNISVTNFSTSEIHILTTFSRTSGKAPERHEVGSLTVPAGSSRELTFEKLDGDASLQNSFVVVSDGAPGALMAKLVSTSDSRLHQVELQAKDASDVENAGNHPWSIEENTESTLLLFNHSDTPQFFDVSIFEGNTSWQKAYKLAPMETEAISFRELVDDQVKDDKGKVLSKIAQSGEVNWMDVNLNKGSGRLLQSDRSAAMARNFSCGYSGLLCGSNVTIYQSYLPDGTVINFADIVPITCTSGQPNYCSGQRTGSGGSFTYSWSSGTPSVASISGSSTYPNVNLLGASLGSSSISGQVRSQYCQSGGGGPVTTICGLALTTTSVTANNCTGQPSQSGVSASITGGSSCEWLFTNSSCNAGNGSNQVGPVTGCQLNSAYKWPANPLAVVSYDAGPPGPPWPAHGRRSAHSTFFSQSTFPTMCRQTQQRKEPFLCTVREEMAE